MTKKKDVTVKFRTSREDCDRLCKYSMMLGQTNSKTIRQALERYFEDIENDPIATGIQPLLPGVEAFDRTTGRKLSKVETAEYISEYYPDIYGNPKAYY